MSRVALFLLVLFPVYSALAHSGHDAPEPHLHGIWEVLLLVAVIGVWVMTYIERAPIAAPRAKARPNPPVTRGPRSAQKRWRANVNQPKTANSPR